MYSWNWFGIYQDGSRVYEFEKGKETLFNKIILPDHSFGTSNGKNILVFAVNNPEFMYHHNATMDAISFNEYEEIKDTKDLKFEIEQYKVGCTEFHFNGKTNRYIEKFVVGLKCYIGDLTYKFLIQIDAFTNELQKVFEKYDKGQCIECNIEKVEA